MKTLKNIYSLTSVVGLFIGIILFYTIIQGGVTFIVNSL